MFPVCLLSLVLTSRVWSLQVSNSRCFHTSCYGRGHRSRSFSRPVNSKNSPKSVHVWCPVKFQHRSWNSLDKRGRTITPSTMDLNAPYPKTVFKEHHFLSTLLDQTSSCRIQHWEYNIFTVSRNIQAWNCRLAPGLPTGSLIWAKRLGARQLKGL